MHDHSSCDHHTPAQYNSAFAVGVGLNTAFVIVEVVFGIANRSLSLLADAGHNLGDVLGLLMGWLAIALANHPATTRHTYGYRKTSVLAALGNSFLLVLGVGAVGWEAIQRLSSPVLVPGSVVMGVAAVGILVNGGTALMFVRGRKDDINREAAYAHMLVDAVVAAGVVLAGLAIRVTHASWIDPVCALVIATLVAIASWRLLRRSLDLALDAVPPGIDLTQVLCYLKEVPGVSDVTDIHIWPVSTTETALTAHIVAPGGLGSGTLERISRDLLHEFAIAHTTIQIDLEPNGGCALEAVRLKGSKIDIVNPGARIH